MLSNSPSRKALGFSFLLTALSAGCREDPAPKPETRATQVPSKQDKPAPDKPAQAAPSATNSVAPAAVKPVVEAVSSAPSVSAAPSASAAAPPSDPPLDCDKLLSLDDVFAACKIKVEAPADQPTEDIGTEGRCVRRFNSKEAGLLTLIVVRHASDEEAKDRYSKDFTVELSKPDVVADGPAGLSRFFLKKGVSGDPILTAEAVKGRFNVTLFNPKVTVGGQTVGPVCEEKPLGKLLVQALSQVP